MYLLIVCLEMMQIFSLGSKLEKFVHLIVLLFLFLGYYYNFFFFLNWGFWVLIPYFVVIFLQLKLFATISWVQSDITFMGFPCSVLSFSILICTYYLTWKILFNSLGFAWFESIVLGLWRYVVRCSVFFLVDCSC